jgi:4a-hydroxytetrahydrobiopterin dehydratase
MKRELLTEEERAALARRLAGWEASGERLERTFRFASYMAGIGFVNRLAEAAEAMDHHPDLVVGWRKVTVRLTTHSAGGVTGLDAELAAEAERLAGVE